MVTPALDVSRATFSIEEPWILPDGCTPTPLRRATDGAPPRLATSVAAYHDEEFLTVLFLCQDDGIVASYLGHDDPLWQEDVVEIFIAPSGTTPYFEIEVNPLGTLFDARIDSPDGVRTTMKTDLSWTCPGLLAILRREDQKTWDVVVRLPFAPFGGRPADGATWRANFFRIDRSDGYGDEFSAWQPTKKNPPDFHVAAAFGLLRFV